MKKILGCEVALVCAGRTDAGVHAWGQVVSVYPKGSAQLISAGRGAPDLEKIRTSLNHICGQDISVRSISWAPPEFDARRSAKSRLYFYHISNRPDLNPLIRRTSWHVSEPLDMKAMSKAARAFKGKHDFTAFCKKPADESKSMVRNVLRVGWEKPEKADPTLLRFYIEANAYCHQMVRFIVGTLVATGKNRLLVKSIPSIIADRDKSRVADPAPAHGLILQEVSY